MTYWCFVGNGWEWGNGMIIDSYCGSFPHSLLSTSKMIKSLEKQRNWMKNLQWGLNQLKECLRSANWSISSTNLQGHHQEWIFGNSLTRKNGGYEPSRRLGGIYNFNPFHSLCKEGRPCFQDELLDGEVIVTFLGTPRKHCVFQSKTVEWKHIHWAR